jgi:transcriptional regulator with XRE-family HTH domain
VHFNEYLKSCREHNHLTQEQLVHDLYTYDIENFEGLDTSTISKWERSITKPPPSKQVHIIKYFQKKTGMPLPCWDKYSIEETEDLICKAGIQNLIGKKLQLILDFPSKTMHVDDFKVYPVRSFERMNVLLDINMDIHQTINHKYTQISLEQFKTWALHPSNLFIACEYKGGFIGLFFTLRLKPEVFNKIINFEMKKSDIREDDFASFDEMGCNYILSFYALNQKCASMLFIRYYAHLIANQRSIAQVGVITTMDDVKKVVSKMNLAYRANKTTKDQIEIQSYSQTLSNVLASENVVKMILLKQTCPED